MEKGKNDQKMFPLGADDPPTASVFFSSGPPASPRPPKHNFSLSSFGVFLFFFLYPRRETVITHHDIVRAVGSTGRR